MIAVAIVAASIARLYGYGLMRTTGFASGKLYPLLRRLTDAGILTTRAEDIDPVCAGRPARTLYLLTPEGTAFARGELVRISSELSVQPARTTPRPSPAGGIL